MRIAPPLCLLLCAAFALFTAGCQLAVGPASPHPNVLIAADKSPGALVFGQDVTADFVIPGTPAVAPTQVKDWRGTLQRGFQSAFGSSNGKRTLELLQADLSFAPAAVNGAGMTRAVRAQIRFKARVLNASGKAIAAFADTVEAREANTGAGPEGMTDNASKAVEAMYESLTANLLAKN